MSVPFLAIAEFGDRQKRARIRRDGCAEVAVHGVSEADVIFRLDVFDLRPTTGMQYVSRTRGFCIGRSGP